MSHGERPSRDTQCALRPSDASFRSADIASAALALAGPTQRGAQCPPEVGTELRPIVLVTPETSFSRSLAWIVSCTHPHALTAASAAGRQNHRFQYFDRIYVAHVAEVGVPSPYDRHRSPKPPGHTSLRVCDVHRCAAAAVQVLVAARRRRGRPLFLPGYLAGVSVLDGVHPLRHPLRPQASALPDLEPHFTTLPQ